MRIALVMALGALSACSATLTPGQSLYGAWRGYSEALGATAAYAQGPTADPVLVQRANEINKSPAIQRAKIFTKAYFACRGNPNTVSPDPQIRCLEFDFSRPSTVAITLRNTAAALLVTLPKGEAR